MSDLYDIHPTDFDLDDESLWKHNGEDDCQPCTITGAHQYALICQCCGVQQSRFELAEYIQDVG